tara:strand:+ start:458 stop:859 length:402 start_codon:yes stop_codon:yes gene_type:complete
MKSNSEKNQSNIEIFYNMFPLQVNVSNTIIKKAKIMRVRECVGALALAKAIGAKGRALFEGNQGPSWGNSTGRQIMQSSYFTLKAVNQAGEDVEMMDVKEPITITFEVASKITVDPFLSQFASTLDLTRYNGR